MRVICFLLVATSLLLGWEGTPLLEVKGQNDTGGLRFADLTRKAGVENIHKTRVFEGEYADTLAMFTAGGASVAVADYDNDGWEDIFVTNSNVGTSNRLFRNLGNMQFEEVTANAGIGGGNTRTDIIADSLWLDYDNDGSKDLLIVRFGTPLLWHNEQDGSFREVTAGAGLSTFGNAIAAISFDYNSDGRLDLLLGNYFPPENLLQLTTTNVLPDNLDNAHNGGGVTLYKNLGGGRFSDATKEAGFGALTGWVLDVGHGDLNGNGLQDVYLACDFGTDKVYFNRGDGTFEDVSEKSIGIDTKKGMNAEIADYDNDGWMDVYVTNITDEYMKECNFLWHNNGDGSFTDLARETGTCDTLWGWSAQFADFDNDGWQDLYAVNGLRSTSGQNYIPVLVNMIITPGVDFSDLRSWPPIGDMTWSGFQKTKLFQNLGMHAFKEVAAAAGVDNDLDGRGLGVGDFNNDGRLDVYQTNADQPSLLYINTTADAGNWLELKLIGGEKSNRDAIGSRLTLEAGDLRMIRRVDGGSGYSGQSSMRVHFGLGSISKIDELHIRWPSGKTETVAVEINQIVSVEEGKGVVAVFRSDDNTKTGRIDSSKIELMAYRCLIKNRTENLMRRSQIEEEVEFGVAPRIVDAYR